MDYCIMPDVSVFVHCYITLCDHAKLPGMLLHYTTTQDNMKHAK